MKKRRKYSKSLLCFNNVQQSWYYHREQSGLHCPIIHLEHAQPTFQYGPHICFYWAYGHGFLTVLLPGTARGPSMLAHMGLGGFLVGLRRAAKGQFNAGTMWVSLVLAHMGLCGFLMGLWRATKGAI